MKWRSIALVIILGLIAWFGSLYWFALRGIRFTDARKLIDCTNSTLAIELNVATRPDYHFVLGVSSNAPDPIKFRGEVTIAQSNRNVTTFPVSSDDMMPCNWIPSTRGLVMAWSANDKPENRLRAFLKQGQKYDVTFQFTKEPPPGSSIWFESMRVFGNK